jgi:hypothetical protein
MKLFNVPPVPGDRFYVDHPLNSPPEIFEVDSVCSSNMLLVKKQGDPTGALYWKRIINDHCYAEMVSDRVGALYWKHVIDSCCYVEMLS